MVVKLAHRSAAPGAVTISSSGRLATEGYTVAHTIPGAELVNGSTYVFVVSGTIGAYRDFQAAGEIVELAIRIGGGIYLGVNLWLDPSYSPHSETFASAFGITDGGSGTPFLFTMQYAPAGQDVHVVARIKKPGSLGTSPGAQFKVDGLAILAFDQTTIAADARVEDVYQTAIGGAGTLIPLGTSSPITLTTVTLPAAGKWLVFSLASVTAANPTSEARVWTEVSGTNIWAETIGFLALGSTSESRQRQYLGQVQVYTASGSTVLTLKADSLSTTGQQSRAWRTEVYAVRIDTTATSGQELNEKVGPTLANFWAEQYAGAALEDTWTITDPSEYLFCAATDGTTPLAGHAPSLELNGGRLWSSELHAQPGSGILPNVPQFRHARPTIDPGDFVVRLYGIRNPFERGAFTSTKFLGKDLRYFGLRLVLDGVVTPPTVVVPGAVVVIVPDLESNVSVASLTALPFEPDVATPVEVSGVIREFRIPKGYQITSPKVLKKRRTWRFRWTGLSETDAETLVAHFDTQQQTRVGVYKWTPTGEFTGIPIVLEAETYRRGVGPSGISWVEIEVAELVYFTA